MKDKKQISFYTSFGVAISVIDTEYTLCNEIWEIDPSVEKNVRFNPYYENGDRKDIYQTYLTDLSEMDVEWNEKTFPELMYSYSELKQCFVLCIPFLGTSPCDVDCLVVNSNWIKKNQDKIKSY